MHFIMSEGVFDVLNGVLKEHPDEIYISEQFMALWVPGWNSSMVVVGDYREHSPEDIERIMMEHVDAVSRSNSKGES